MITGIYFDQETRSFSAKDVLSSVSKHVNKNKRAYIDAATTVAGGAMGNVLARKAAQKQGLKPGTPEYKKFIAKRTVAGAGMGLAAAEAGQFAHKTVKGARQSDGSLRGLGMKERLISSAKKTGSEMYVDPVKNGLDKVKGLVKRKK